MARELNILALIKGHERFIFVYDDVSRQSLIEARRDQAADPHLSLNWFDAAVLTDKARQQAPEPELEELETPVPLAAFDRFSR